MRYILLVFTCLYSPFVFAQSAKGTDTATYNFEVKLVETVPLPPGCGYIAFAVVHLFEVLRTDCPGYTDQYVLIIEECPEFKGENFFVAGKQYEIVAAKNSNVTFGFDIYNNYENEHIPKFWSRKTELVKN